MRNLKKVLSLVLCMAMMLSIMVVGAGAAFKDQSKIVNEEAVDMCSALNIINGYTDGSFKPEGTITRAEACKMICVALNGGKEPVLGTNATATFTDIKGHWAEKYIEYCVSEGIVAGIGGGKFNPNGNVTGSQFAKMLLIALGYRADHEKFVGNAWEVNVNVKAAQKHLYDELGAMDPSQALTRDNAAQMVWNALQAKEVAYEYTLVSENGQLVSKVTVEDKTITLLKDKYDAQEWTGTIKEYNDKQEAVFANLAGVNDSIPDFEAYTKDDSDLIGKTIKVLYKVNATGKDTIYGLFLDDDNTYIDTIAGNVTDYVDATQNDADTVKVDGTKYKISTAGDVSAIATEKSANPVTVTLDKDGKVASIVKDTFSVVKVTFVGSKSINTTGRNYTDLEKVEAYDGIKKDDWAVVSVNNYTNKTVLTKADVIEGKVEVVNVDDITIDGTKYTKASAGATSLSDLALGNTVKAVVVDGYIYNSEKVSGIGSLADVVYISAVKASDDYGTKTIMAKATFSDGTSSEIKIAKADDTNIGGVIDYNTDTTANKNAFVSAVNNNNLLDGLWAFKIEDGKYTLTGITDGENKDFDQKTTTDTAGKDKIGGLRVNDDAVVFLEDKDGDVTVVTGATVAAWQAMTSGVDVTAYANKTNGVAYVELAALVLSVDTPDAANDAVYGYITSVIGQTKEDNTTYNSYVIWTADGEKTVKVKKANDELNSGDLASKGVFVKYENDKLTALPTTYSVLNGIAGDNVYFGIGATEFVVTDDTQIIYISAADKTGVEGGSLQLAVDVDDDDVKDFNVLKGAKATQNSDGAYELLYIFVDVNNDIENKLGN